MSDDTVDKVVTAIRDGIFSDAGNRHIARECIAIIEEPLLARIEEYREKVFNQAGEIAKLRAELSLMRDAYAPQPPH